MAVTVMGTEAPTGIPDPLAGCCKSITCPVMLNTNHKGGGVTDWIVKPVGTVTQISPIASFCPVPKSFVTYNVNCVDVFAGTSDGLMVTAYCRLTPLLFCVEHAWPQAAPAIARHTSARLTINIPTPFNAVKVETKLFFELNTGRPPWTSK